MIPETKSKNYFKNVRTTFELCEFVNYFALRELLKFVIAVFKGIFPYFESEII